MTTATVAPAYIDAGATRQHLEGLAAHGVGTTTAARAAGVSHHVAHRVRSGATRRIQPAHAAALQAVTADDIGDRRQVDATDAHRTLQRLADAGVPSSWLARRLGLANIVRIGAHRITAKRAAEIAELGRLLDAGELHWDPPPSTVPPARRVTRTSIDTANNTARKTGRPPVYDDGDVVLGELVATLEARIDQQPWRAHAACAGMPVHIFFPTGGPRSGEEARAVCARCPVADDCAEANRHVRHGIYGGRNHNERKQAR